MGIKEKINFLNELNFDLYGKDFLLTREKTLDELKTVCTVAEIFREMHKNNLSFRIFDSGLGVSIFRDQSTRTRFSFASAINALGLELAELDEVKSQIAHGETVRESAVMISFLAEVIGIRDDMYLGEGNKYMREVADSVEQGYKNGILHQRPNVINLQCDIDHPTQTISDLLKLKDYFGSFENLKGKKIAMTWAYSPSYGKPLSVPQGIIWLLTRFGMNVSLAHPKGYNLIPDIVDIALENVKKAGGSFIISDSMEESFKNADVVYPKSWAPFEVMKKRTELLKNSDKKGLVELEKECLLNNAKYKTWECNNENMKMTKNGSALYMHCLPADISGVSCSEGEVSEEIFEKYRLNTYHQASFKPFVIASMIYLSRINNPAETINKILNRNLKKLI